jgi:RND family efflux transporter MFP subunit
VNAVRKLVLVGMALLAAALGGLIAARQRPDREIAAPARPPPPAHRPAAAQPDQEAFVGVIFARQQVDLASTAQAVVETVPVQLGSQVERGDTIATLDADAVRRELAAAGAAVRAANADLSAARVELAAASEKVKRLSRFPEGVPGEEIVSARTRERLLSSQLVGARARVGGAMARVEQLRVLVENAAIVAPFDGVIAARYVDPGALVGPGKPIARLISADDLWVRFAVAEERAGTVHVKACVRVALRSPDLSVPGSVEMVAPQVDTALRMLIAEARLSVPDEWRGKLQAGLAAEVSPVACGPS